MIPVTLGVLFWLIGVPSELLWINVLFQFIHSKHLTGLNFKWTLFDISWYIMIYDSLYFTQHVSFDSISFTVFLKDFQDT